MTEKQELTVTYTFWPVGQGLFASGALHDGHSTRFHWVYDCGTASEQKYLKSALKKYRVNAFAGAVKPKIDLVTISHFDTDHISGLVDLLQQFSVDTLLLPYMPLWQRILVAFSEGVDSQQRIMRFFVNPVGFIADAGGNQGVRRIVFVSPSDESPPVPDADEGQGPVAFELTGRFSTNSEIDQEQQALTESSQGVSGIRPEVQFLAKNSALAIGRFWEFVPYNDASIKVKVGAGALAFFQDRVAAARDQLLATPSAPVLVTLRDLYDRRFGKNPLARNVISLFLYAGPIRSTSPGHNFIGYKFASPGKLMRWAYIRWPTRTSILYTGDGYLDTQRRFDGLRKYLKISRIAKISCLQVMHHGAENNWFEGLAGKLMPDISVFSSDPGHKGYGHPHGPVVRNFLKYNPVQVDKTTGLRITAPHVL